MTMKASVITTVLNEINSIEAFLNALDDQTRTPDEVIVVDAGSSDGTVEAIRRFAVDRPWLTLIQEPGNRSHGRNTAIDAASHDVIACADAGSLPDPWWLANLLKPFDDGADWVAGFYWVDAASVVDRCGGLTIVYVEEEVDADSFLPSARSMAFTKKAWNTAGRFPEHVDFGEDTLFGVRMRAAGIEPTLALDATVSWHPPSGFDGLARTTFRWGRGDAVARVRGMHYKRTLGAVMGAAALTVVLGTIKPALAWFGIAPLVPGIWKSTRNKYRHEEHPAKWVLLPAARVVATSANLAGYVVGRAVGE